MVKGTVSRPRGLSTRAIHVVIRVLSLDGVLNEEILAKKASSLTRSDLEAAENCGPATIREIEHWLGTHSLRLTGSLSQSDLQKVEEAIALLERHGYRVYKGNTR